MHILVSVVLPAITQAAWAPADISSIQTALTNWQNNVFPNQITMPDILDASGNPQPAYADLQAQAPQVLAAWNNYNTWASELPGTA